MNIGEAAKKSGVNAKMIRHYEEISLLPKAQRTEAGYRVYNENDVQTLKFIRRARVLGFPMKEIKKLLSLWRNKARSSRDVKELAQSHIQELEVKVRELNEVISSLKHLASHCHGSDRPECPILEGLGESHVSGPPSSPLGRRT